MEVWVAGGWGRPRKSWEENSPKPITPSGTPHCVCHKVGLWR